MALANRDSEGAVRRIVILGGGTAGWMAAAYLSRALNASGPRVDIVLVESAAIGTVGVGEGTVPSIRPAFFDFLGIPEREWMAACGASFKLGIKFVDWAETPQGPAESAFYHTFGEALEIAGIPLTHYWLRRRLTGRPPDFARACYPTASLCDGARAPKAFDGMAHVPYAYHFDATLLAGFLRDWATARGVRHTIDEIVHVAVGDDGHIRRLEGRADAYHADLYVDCSGLSAVLLHNALGVPFLPYDGYLLCDRAVALRLPARERTLVRPYTTATALSAGWVWEIDLHERSGNGYVYSSAHISDEEAERELRRFLGAEREPAPARPLRWRAGRRDRAWVGNCVSIGLSTGFIEPLEATSIYFIFAALHHLVRYFPSRRMEAPLRDRFNERIAYMYDDVRDFLVLHYCTTRRADTPFWRANRHELRIPDSLQAILDEYRAGAPVKLPYAGAQTYNSLGFDAGFDRFWTNSNYVAILAGMGVLPDRPMSVLEFMPDAVCEADDAFRAIARRAALLVRDLPTHADYLERLHEPVAM